MNEVAVTHRYLKALGTRGYVSFSDGMHDFLGRCAKARPHRSWKQLERFDWEREIVSLSAWLAALLVAEPPPQGTRGYFVGLFNPIERRRATAELYVAGYAAPPGERDWTTDATWWPQGRYAGSRATRLVYATAYGRDGLQNAMEYPVCLVTAALAARTLAQTLAPQLLLRGERSCRLAAGFDSGDIVEVGTLRPRAFAPGYRC